MVTGVWASHRSASGPHSDARLALGTLLAAAGGVPVALRRVRPLAALGALGAISVALSVIAAQYGLIVAPPAAYVLYMVAATCRRRVAAIALAGTLCLVLGESFNVWRSDGGRLGSAVTPGLILIIFWGLGSAVRQRRAYANGLQRQAASRAVAEERLRIARELHDVVAHSMSVIAVQAGFGQYVIDDQPGKAREALGAIQATSRDALDEMRRMLSVLRQADTAGDDAPVTTPQADQPGELDRADRADRAAVRAHEALRDRRRATGANERPDGRGRRAAVWGAAAARSRAG